MITVTIKRAVVLGVERPDWVTDGHHEYVVTIVSPDGQLEVPFFCGPAAGEPTVKDVWECLLSDAATVIQAEDVWDWYDELGLAPSREHHAMWDRVKAQTQRLAMVVGGRAELERMIYNP